MTETIVDARGEVLDFEPDGERCPNCGAVFAVWGMRGEDMADDTVVPTEQEAAADYCPFCGEALP